MTSATDEVEYAEMRKREALNEDPPNYDSALTYDLVAYYARQKARAAGQEPNDDR